LDLQVKVRLVDSDYWAEVNNFGSKFVHVPTQYVVDYERLLTGGIWAQIEMRFAYDEDGKNPFWIDKLTPVKRWPRGRCSAIDMEVRMHAYRLATAGLAFVFAAVGAIGGIRC
jgi:predicted ATP-dependent Lon-type protease